MDETNTQSVSDVSEKLTKETVLIEIDAHLVRKFDRYFRAESDSQLVAYVLDEFFTKFVKYQQRLSDLKAARQLFKQLKSGGNATGPKAIARPVTNASQQASERIPK